MKNKYVFVASLLISMFLIGLIFTNLYVINQENESDDTVVINGQLVEKVNIVTSFYPMYVATLNIVGDAEDIKLTNLSEPKTGCLHDYQMTPADMKLLSKADIFVVNGGGIESFLTDVTESYPKVNIVEACKDILLLEEQEEGHDEEAHDHDHESVHVHEHGEEGNAHAWMSVSTYREMVKSIADQLMAADPKHKSLYKANAAKYDAKLEALETEQKTVMEQLSGMRVISFHEAFAYVAKDYGMQVVCTIDFDEERPISAGEPAQVLEAIQHDGATVILAEELYGKNMAETIMAEDDVEVTVLYLDPLNKGDYNKNSYLQGMRANIDLIKELMVN